MKNKDRRRRIVCDSKLQYGIALSAVAHWVAFAVAAMFFVLAWHVVTNWRVASADSILQSVCERYGPLLVVLLAFIPVIIYDSIKQSHRFTGPTVRFRNTVQRLADGENVDFIRLRNGDHGMELAEDLNRLIDRIQNPDGTSSGTSSGTRHVERKDAAVTAAKVEKCIETTQA